MNGQSTSIDKFKQISLIAVVLMVCAPISYFALVYFMKNSENMQGVPNPAITYALLSLAVVSTATIPMLHRWYVSSAQKSRSNRAITDVKVAQLFIIKMALVETTYMYGLLVFFVTGQTDWLWAFNLIGISWTIFVWPTRERFEETARQLEAA